MYGFQDLASQQQQRFWIYTGNKNSTGFQTWLKPPGINFIHIIAIGAGGGGSSAAIWQTGVARTGGGGGGSGGMTSVFLPAYLVPDTVYVNVGIGGAGGASTNTTTPNAGVAGTATYVLPACAKIVVPAPGVNEVIAPTKVGLALKIANSDPVGVAPVEYFIMLGIWYKYKIQGGAYAPPS
jgi:hypothetical protein